MTSEGRFDVEFNEMLDEELGGLEELSREELKAGIQKVRNLLQKRNERRRLSLTDEVSRMPAEMRCEVFRNFSDSKLIDCIVAYPDFETTAGYVLQRRKYMVRLDVASDYQRNLKMECMMYASKEDKHPKSDISKKLRFSSDLSLSNYICGYLYVVLRFTTATDYGIKLDSFCCSNLEPEKYFGSPPTDKFKYKGHLRILGKAFAPLLKWICPTKLTYSADPELLFDSRGQLTIEGVENLVIDRCWSSNRLWSDVMEKCKAPLIQLGYSDFWGRTSFFASLTEHANSGEGGAPRVVEISKLMTKEELPAPWHLAMWEKISRYNETEEQLLARWKWSHKGWPVALWEKRFKDWRTGHVAQYGKLGRDVTYEVKPDEHDLLMFKLTLD